MARDLKKVWLAHFVGPAMEWRDVRAGERVHEAFEREIEASTEKEAWRKARAYAAETGEGLEVSEIEEIFPSLEEILDLGYGFWSRQPVIERGHFDNLVYDDGGMRVWVSRQTLADYAGDRRAWLADRMTVEEKGPRGWKRVLGPGRASARSSPRRGTGP